MNKPWKCILQEIKKADIITIYGHINPDCDSYGSELSLREILRDNFPKKQIYAIGKGGEHLYKRLTKYDEVDDEVIKQSLAIICDCSEIERIADQRVRLAKKIIKIDHHIESRPFFGVKWVDVEAVACCQMIAQFGLEAKLKISKLAAELMYLGICTDSGRFRYNPTNEYTHAIVSNLYKLGIEPQSIFDILYLSEENFVKYQALLVSKFKRTKHNVIYCFADCEDYEQFGFKFEQISKNVNVIGNIVGCPIWCLFTRNRNNEIRIEFRSNGPDIHQIAVKYGGGGHKCAAGALLKNETDFRHAEKVVADLDELASKIITK